MWEFVFDPCLWCVLGALSSRAIILLKKRERVASLLLMVRASTTYSTVGLAALFKSPYSVRLEKHRIWNPISKSAQHILLNVRPLQKINHIYLYTNTSQLLASTSQQIIVISCHTAFPIVCYDMVWSDLVEMIIVIEGLE